jgi:predicted O-methyltransferase YrrM
MLGCEEARMNWITKFQEQYYPMLMPKDRGLKFSLADGHFHRAPGFLLMFQKLLAQRNNNFKIIETGTLRKPGNWKDGQSAFLFTEFVDCYGGTVRSVDIDSVAVDVANEYIKSKNFTSHCSDSVKFLQEQTDLNDIDLFYLDSWDVKWEDDTASAEHHLKEFMAIEPHLKAGAVVAIDDNSRHRADNRRTGKGRRIVEYLASKNILPIYDHYQIIYQF